MTDSTRSDADSGGSADSTGSDAGRQGPTGELSRSATKDPDQWVTGDQPMTGPQESYLQTLAREAGEEVPHDLSKAEASKRIDALQEETGRG